MWYGSYDLQKNLRFGQRNLSAIENPILGLEYFPSGSRPPSRWASGQITFPPIQKSRPDSQGTS
jgi:hypothetical protein